MPTPLTVEQLVPLVEALPPEERARLVRLLVGTPDADASLYSVRPTSRDEFSSDEDPLEWDSGGWENVT